MAVVPSVPMEEVGKPLQGISHIPCVGELVGQVLLDCVELHC